MDAVNGFNSRSSSAALWNTYQGFAFLILRDASCYVLSKGVTQGVPLGMMFYGAGLLPLARKLIRSMLVNNFLPSLFQGLAQLKEQSLDKN